MKDEYKLYESKNGYVRELCGSMCVCVCVYVSPAV